jgi:DNA polymerase III subunit epsilon
MEKPGTRLVQLTGTLACPAPGTGPFTGFLARVESGRTGRDPFADGRSLGTRARPERVSAGVGAGRAAPIASPA